MTWIKIFCWNEAAHSRPRCLRVSLMCEFPFSTAPLNFNTQVRSSQLSRTVKVQELNLSFKLSQSQINPGSAAARSGTFLLVTIENPLCYIQSEWAAISLSNLLFFLSCNEIWMNECLFLNWSQTVTEWGMIRPLPLCLMESCSHMLNMLVLLFSHYSQYCGCHWNLSLPSKTLSRALSTLRISSSVNNSKMVKRRFICWISL